MIVSIVYKKVVFDWNKIVLNGDMEIGGFWFKQAAELALEWVKSGKSLNDPEFKKQLKTLGVFGI